MYVQARGRRKGRERGGRREGEGEREKEEGGGEVERGKGVLMTFNSQNRKIFSLISLKR